MKYTTLAIENPVDLIYGKSPKPLTTRHGMEIGGGLIYPELNGCHLTTALCEIR